MRTKDDIQSKKGLGLLKKREKFSQKIYWTRFGVSACRDKGLYDYGGINISLIFFEMFCMSLVYTISFYPPYYYSALYDQIIS